MTLELRFSPEIRVAVGGRTLYGVACPFGREARINGPGGGFREVVSPGAFRASLSSGADITALKDHRGDALLARTRTGSLKLSETSVGLEYELTLPPTPTGDEIAYFAGRGELAGCSIGFEIAPGGEAWSSSLRTLTGVHLDHVAVVSGGRPAYENTSTNIRHQAGHGLTADALRRRRWMAML